MDAADGLPLTEQLLFIYLFIYFFFFIEFYIFP